MAEELATVDEEREYTLTEAARILGKTEAAIRMKIKRNTLQAVQRPIDESGSRYKYMIPESEIEREKTRGESDTPRIGEPWKSASNVTTIARRTPTFSDALSGADGGLFAAVEERLARMEADIQREREDTRALIRSLDQQVDLLKMMVTSLIGKK